MQLPQAGRAFGRKTECADVGFFCTEKCCYSSEKLKRLQCPAPDVTETVSIVGKYLLSRYFHAVPALPRLQFIQIPVDAAAIVLQLTVAVSHQRLQYFR